MNSAAPPRFWEQKALDQLSQDEWEALCDGCGLCCQVKLQDADDPRDDRHAEVYLTSVACRLLDCDSCRCRDYRNRKQKVPECLVLTPDNLADCAPWLPDSCGYVCLLQGRALPDWHPLLTGEKDSAQTQGPGMAGRLRSETRVPDDALEDYVIPWPALSVLRRPDPQ